MISNILLARVANDVAKFVFENPQGSSLGAGPSFVFDFPALIPTEAAPSLSRFWKGWETLLSTA